MGYIACSYFIRTNLESFWTLAFNPQTVVSLMFDLNSLQKIATGDKQTLLLI